MTKQRHQALHVFLDFDGTISKRDVIDVILERYADERWLVLENEWRAGRIGSRTCLAEQMALVRATQAELAALLGSIEIDEGLNVLSQVCAAYQIPIHVISDGFDYCISRILVRSAKGFARLERGLRVCASHLEPKGENEWSVDFPFFHPACAHGCATCKPAVMSLLNSADAPTIFVGDGLSDKYAATSADLVFAKKSLATYCREQRLAHVAYDDLEDVAAYLETALQRGTDFSARELMERVGA